MIKYTIKPNTLKKIFITLVLLSIYGFNANAQWQKTNCPNGGETLCLAVNDSNIFAGTKDSGVYRSSNYGNTWVKIDTGLKHSGVSALAINDSIVFAGTLDSGMFMSSNYGNTWTLLNNSLPTNYNFTAIAISGTNIFASTLGKGIYMSSNNGQNWTAINIGLSNKLVMSLFKYGDTLFAGTELGPSFRSSNNGLNWDTMNTGLPTTYSVVSFAMSGTNIFAGTSYGLVYMSSNYGSSWETTGLTTNNKLNALAVYGDTIYAGTWNYGVMVSDSLGVTWTSDNIGLRDTVVKALAISGKHLFAGTDSGGVWKMSVPILGINEIKNNENHILTYPNPTTSNITIDAGNLQSKVNDLRMYDVVGNLILEKSININNKTSLNVSAFPSGIYIMEITTENGVAEKKFIKE